VFADLAGLILLFFRDASGFDVLGSEGDDFWPLIDHFAIWYALTFDVATMSFVGLLWRIHVDRRNACGGCLVMRQNSLAERNGHHK
jgi:hypothetical protein